MFEGGAQGLRRAGGVAFLTVLSMGGCVRNLPPAAPPEAVVPAVAVNSSVPSGRARLVVDVVEGPTSVHRIEMQAQPNPAGQPGVHLFQVPSLLCQASPCVADLPVGNVLLGFPVSGDSNRLDIELVHVGPETTVYRRALSEYHGATGPLYALGIIGTSIGSASAITGMTLLPIGLSKHNDGLTTAGGVTLAAGAVLIAVGIWWIRHDGPTYRPGAAIHFSLPSPAR